MTTPLELRPKELSRYDVSRLRLVWRDETSDLSRSVGRLLAPSGISGEKRVSGVRT